MAKLVIYEEADEETVFEDFELLANRILIGSSPDNQLVLDAPDIDPAHASLELRHDHWILQDLGAPGGTVVNGMTVEGPYYLQHDDLIELAHIKIRFRDVEPAVESESTPLEEEEEEQLSELPPVRGRVWFAKVAAGTVVIIFLILIVLIIGHYLGLLNVADLLPPWLPQSL